MGESIPIGEGLTPLRRSALEAAIPELVEELELAAWMRELLTEGVVSVAALEVKLVERELVLELVTIPGGARVRSAILEEDVEGWSRILGGGAPDAG